MLTEGGGGEEGNDYIGKALSQFWFYDYSIIEWKPLQVSKN
jgi:hypothetical protein